MKKVVVLGLSLLMIIGSAAAEFDQKRFESFGYDYQDGYYSSRSDQYPYDLFIQPDSGPVSSVGVDIAAIFDEEIDCFFPCLSFFIITEESAIQTPNILVMQTEGLNTEHWFSISLTNKGETPLGYFYTACYIPIGTVLEDAIVNAAFASVMESEPKTLIQIYSEAGLVVDFALTYTQLTPMVIMWMHFKDAGGVNDALRRYIDKYYLAKTYSLEE